VQLLKNFPAFHGTRRFITMFTRAFYWTILSQIDPIHTIPSYLKIKKKYSGNRPWRPIGLFDVEAPTFSR
jgi:hypothetical protein